MKRTSPLWMLLSAALTVSFAHAAPGTLLRDETLRTQASATAAVSAQASKGTAVEIITRQGGWLQVKTAKSQGWVRLLSVRTGSGGAGGTGVGDVLGAATSQSNPSRVVAVAGVRGLNEEELKTAKFSPDELARLENAAVTREQASANASRVGLVVTNVPALPKSQSRTEPAKASWGDN